MTPLLDLMTAQAVLPTSKARASAGVVIVEVSSSRSPILSVTSVVSVSSITNYREIYDTQPIPAVFGCYPS
jgi:hypothetical protein